MVIYQFHKYMGFLHLSTLHTMPRIKCVYSLLLKVWKSFSTPIWPRTSYPLASTSHKDYRCVSPWRAQWGQAGVGVSVCVSMRVNGTCVQMNACGGQRPLLSVLFHWSPVWRQGLSQARWAGNSRESACFHTSSTRIVLSTWLLCGCWSKSLCLEGKHFPDANA